jgi:hypothetical protein
VQVEFGLRLLDHPILRVMTGRHRSVTEPGFLTRNLPARRGIGTAVRGTKETTMRVIALATLLAATLGSPSAFAQGSYVHHNFCLKSGSSTECAYDSMAQCQASKHSGTDSCVPNSAPENH